ncbi:MAG TPA: Do family serine endopeptidase [Gemmatimonadaceae bacterium]|nr:Do family serine endopeptidase [Gemmatimonadaceae bacterium]
MRLPNFSALRQRPIGTAAMFFVVGVFFASAMDWTPGTQAQQSGPVTARNASQTLKGLEETSNAFAAIAEHVTPAVVAIQTRTRQRTVERGSQEDRNLPPEIRRFFGEGNGGPQVIPPQQGSGSGFIISPDGYIVTNRHVVNNADQISVAMADHKTYAAKLVGQDEQTDVAVIKIDGKNLPTIDIGDDERMRVGEWVLAIGNPLGLDFTVTAGIVSAKGRTSSQVRVGQSTSSITDFIQTDAAINMGNSGGPLVNIRGEVVGINTAIASPTGYNAGYGFAIPVGLARVVWQDLIEHGRIVRAQLGVSIGEVTPEDAQAAGLRSIGGAMVSGCNPSETESPACRAGLREGDVIVAVDGKSVDRVSTLQRAVRSKKPGESARVAVMRYGKEMNFNVKLNEMESARRVADAGTTRSTAVEKNVGSPLGIQVEAVSEQFAKTNEIPAEFRGLRIVDVDPEGPSGEKLAPIDVIVAALPSGERVRTPEDLQKALSGKRPGDVVSFKVYDLDRQTTRIANVRIGNK